MGKPPPASPAGCGRALLVTGGAAARPGARAPSPPWAPAPPRACPAVASRYCSSELDFVVVFEQQRGEHPPPQNGFLQHGEAILDLTHFQRLERRLREVGERPRPLDAVLHAEGVEDRNLNQPPDVIYVAEAVELIRAGQSAFPLVAHPTEPSRFCRGLRIGRVVRPAELAVRHGRHATGLAVCASGCTVAVSYPPLLTNHYLP